MPILRIPQLKKEFEVPLGSNLMEFLLQNDIPVASSCHGDGVCGKCRMTLRCSPSSVNPPQQLESFLITKMKLGVAQRISCQVQILGDVEVETSYW